MWNSSFNTDEALHVLAAEVQQLRPLLVEVRQLRVLAFELHQFWLHIRRQGFREEQSSWAARSNKDIRAGVEAEWAGEDLRNWVHKEFEKMRSEHSSEYSRLLAGQNNLQKQISEELEVIHGWKRDHESAQEAWAKINTEDRIRCLDHKVFQLGSQDLDFGPPIAKSLNSQEWLSMYNELRHGLEECRSEVRQLALQVGCNEATLVPRVTRPAAKVASLHDESGPWYGI